LRSCYSHQSGGVKLVDINFFWFPWFSDCHQNNTGRTEGKNPGGTVVVVRNTTDNNNNIIIIKHDLLICEVLGKLAFRLDVSRCDIFDISSRCDNLEPPGTGIDIEYNIMLYVYVIYYDSRDL
jgi:hypothetical protein